MGPATGSPQAVQGPWHQQHEGLLLAKPHIRPAWGRGGALVGLRKLWFSEMSQKLTGSVCQAEVVTGNYVQHTFVRANTPESSNAT